MTMWFFRAAEALRALAVLCRGFIDVGGDRRGADKSDRAYLWMFQDCIDGGLVAVDDVENAWRQTGFDEEFGEAKGYGGIALRGFEDEGVAAGNGRCAFPQRYHGRKIERRDAGNHAERLAHGIDVDAGACAFGVFPP